MKQKNFFLLIVSLAVSLSAGFFGSFFTITGPGTWYDLLTKPSFNPPNWIFAPVWTLLFIFMGIALFLVWRRAETKVQILHIWRYFSLQLIFNILWSFCFFYLQNPRLAFLEIIALIIFIIAMMIHFYKIDKRSLYLLLPYLIWVAFATLLTYSIWQLN